MERASNAMKFSTLILKKVKTNRPEAVLDVFPKQPFSCVQYLTRFRKSVFFACQFYRKSVVLLAYFVGKVYFCGSKNIGKV